MQFDLDVTLLYLSDPLGKQNRHLDELLAQLFSIYT